MFVLDESPSYWWPVEITQASNKKPKGTIEIEFKRITKDRLKEFFNTDEMTDEQVMDEVVLNWKGVHLKSGEGETPYSKEARIELCKKTNAQSSIIKALTESLLGTKIKN